MVGGPQNAATHTACQTATHGAFHQKKPGKPPGGLQTMAVGPTKNATHTACQTATHGAFHQKKPGKLPGGLQTMAVGPTKNATHTACQTATPGAAHLQHNLQKNATHTACLTATHGAFHQRKPGKPRGVQTMARGTQNLFATVPAADPATVAAQPAHPHGPHVHSGKNVRKKE